MGSATYSAAGSSAHCVIKAVLLLLMPTRRWHRSHIKYGSCSRVGPPHSGQDAVALRDHDRMAMAMRISAVTMKRPTQVLMSAHPYFSQMSY